MDAAVAAAGWFVHIAIDKYFDRKLEQWASRAGLLDDFRRLRSQSSMARATLTIVHRRECESLPNDALLVLIKELQLAAVDVDHVLGEMDCCRLTGLSGSTAGALRAALRRSADLLRSPFACLQLGEISARAKSVSARLEHAAVMVSRIVRLEQSVLTTRLLLQLQEVDLCRSCSSMAGPKIQPARDEDDSSNTNNGVDPRSRAGAKRKRGRESRSGTSSGRDNPPAGCTIPEVMDLVRHAGAEVGSDEHFVATQLFVRLEFREMFLTLEAPEQRIAWLKRMWDDRKRGQ